LLLALLAALVLGVAACGDDDDDNGGGSSTNGDAAADTKSGLPNLEGKKIDYLGFGGTTDENIKKAWADPFSKATGAEFSFSFPTDYGKIQAQLEAGAVTYDVVDGDPFLVIPTCGETWQELDVDLSAVQEQYRPPTECAVPDYVYSNQVAFSKNAFPNGGPQDCPDFFDTERFPGDRGVWTYAVTGSIECAAIAAGADPKDPYPIDIDAAFEEFEKIRDDLVVYDTVAQAVDQMQNEDAAMGIYSGRMIYDAINQGAPFDFSIKWAARAYGSFQIPKGAPDADAAEAFLNYIMQPDVNRRYFREYSPSQGSPTGGPPSPKIKGHLRDLVPTIAPIDDVAMDLDWTWWAENEKAVTERWNNFLAGG
jgi:putative spermidine/putrescine transport system substrate-binding protein